MLVLVVYLIVSMIITILHTEIAFNFEGADSIRARGYSEDGLLKLYLLIFLPFSPIMVVISAGSRFVNFIKGLPSRLALLRNRRGDQRKDGTKIRSRRTHLE